VTLRSASGNRDAVVLDAGYSGGAAELVYIDVEHITIADLTLKRAWYHAVHIVGGGHHATLYNLRIVDSKEQFVKVNQNGGDYADWGLAACNELELTDAGRTHIRNDCYTGGLDAHAATGWRVWRNRVEGFWCDDGLSEHGIHMWRASADTVVEENVVVDCARGIGFGLGPGADGHSGGVIRNNFIAAADGDLFVSEYGFDAGIALWGAEGAEVYHNTVASTQEPFSSIEWRFISTSVTLANNLSTGPIRDRGGTAYLTTNLEDVPIGLFAGVAAGDLHLLDPESSPVDSGTPLASGQCDSDIDRQPRDAEPDIGADEFGWGIFADGFESGDTGEWSSTIGGGT
jgi:hypothetical protein